MISFLFDEKKLGEMFYGAAFNTEMLGAMEKVSPTGILGFALGDMLVLEFVMRPDQVEFNEERFESVRLAVDQDYAADIAAELFSSLKSVEHRFDIDDPLYLIQNNIYLFTITNLTLEFGLSLDSVLRSKPYYIGFVQPDLQNRLHYQLFFDYLVKDNVYEAGKIYRQRDFDESNDYVPDWIADTVGDKNVVLLEYEQYQEKYPNPVLVGHLSEGGARFEKIIRKRKTPFATLTARLASGRKIQNNTGKAFTFENNVDFSLDKIVVKKEKIVGYLLSKDHPVGRNKAAVFERLLGITSSDWEFLVSQLIEGLLEGDPKSVKVTEFGIQYDVDVQITGRNGLSKTLCSAWIFKEDKTIFLTTAYILKENEQSTVAPPVKLYQRIPKGEFQTLFDYARLESEKASSETIPTPMYIVGYKEPVMEGMCGGAYLSFDLRTSFGKWIASNIAGCIQTHPGIRYYSPLNTQSLALNRSYIETFYKVLRFNGITCSFGTYID